MQSGVGMILPVSNFNKNLIFKGEQTKDTKLQPKEVDRLLDNNLSTRSKIALDKVTKAFTVYPARGIKGSINSDFYEFLTMGTVPYIVGSLTLMSVFNSAAKHFPAFDASVAGKLGKKMALGVLFYGIAKPLSKSLVNLPVKWITGVDTQLPYLKVNHRLPEHKGDFDLTSHEYHKVGESVEFTRWDLLYGNPDDKKDLNKRYDKIAKKLGLGENLNDSDQVVKPIYREILVKSNLARSFASYMWAAVGVALAFQKPWDKFFGAMSFNIFKPKQVLHGAKVFAECFIESAKELYNPTASAGKLQKYSGKGVIGAAALVTLLGVLNTLHINKRPSKVSENDVLDKNKESVAG